MLRALLWWERYSILGSYLYATLPLRTLSILSCLTLEPSISSKLAWDDYWGLIPLDPRLWVDRMLVLAFKLIFLTRLMWFKLPLSLLIGLACSIVGSIFVLYSCIATLIGLTGSSASFLIILGIIDLLSCFIGIVRSSLAFELMLKLCRVSPGSRGVSYYFFNDFNDFIEPSLMNFEETFLYRVLLNVWTFAYGLASYFSDFCDGIYSMSALK